MLQLAIRESRTTWLRLLRQFMTSLNLHLPFSIDVASELSATTLRTCLQSALCVRKNLHAGLPVSVIDFPPQLPITWMRIVRSRWILVASCNEHQSLLTCWDSAPSHDPSLPEQVFQHSLAGPVVDGEVDDGPYGIVIAVTIETWPTKICVLGVQFQERTTSLRHLLEITGGSYVATVCGEWLAYRVHDGAEEAQLVQWTTGVRHHLDSTTVTGDYPCHRPEVRGAAISIAIWHHYVIVVFRREVHIFHSLKSPALLQTEVIPSDEIRSSGAAFFLVQSDEDHLTRSLANCPRSDRRLLLFTRDTTESYFGERVSITSFSPSTEKGCHPRLILTSLEFVEDPSMRPFLAHEMTLSTSGSMLTWINGDLLGQPELVFLHFPRNFDAPTLHELPQDSTAVVHSANVEHLPFLVPRSSMVLDDRRGLLVVGTIDGKLTMARFHDPGAWTGLRSSIASLQIASDKIGVRNIGNNRPIEVRPRWPHVECSNDGQPVADSNVRHIFASDWGQQSSGALPEGWTTDWENFDDAADWFPCSRWLAHRGDAYANGEAGRLCQEYGAIGIPIPLCRGGRHVDPDHESVIFRIGRRPYITRPDEFMIPFGVDGHAMSIEEVLSDPTAAYRRSVYTRNTGMHPIADGQAEPLWYQRSRSVTLRTASEYVSSHPEMNLARSADPSSWTLEEWENVSDAEPLSGFKF